MRKRLSLTFDNGPTVGITEHVLDTLDDFGIKATFFLVGSNLTTIEQKRLADRALGAGHRIGNHSYSHGEPLGLHTSPGTAADEILRAHSVLKDYVGERPLYRPNGRGKMGKHLLNREAVDALIGIHATVVLWNSVPRDRAAVVDRPDLWVEDARKAVEDRDWTLMVLHDRPSGFSDPAPMSFLPTFLAWASETVEFRPDFPIECTPLLDGVPQENIESFVAD